MTNFIKNNRQSGMSLLEVMVAFSILTLVFIALTQAFPLSISITESAENATKASYVAQSQLESLTSLGYKNIGTGEIESRHRLANDPADYLYYFQRQTEVNYVDSNLANSVSDTNLKKIAVTVYYTNSWSKTEKTYVTSTLITSVNNH